MFTAVTDMLLIPDLMSVEPHAEVLPVALLTPELMLLVIVLQDAETAIGIITGTVKAKMLKRIVK